MIELTYSNKIAIRSILNQIEWICYNVQVSRSTMRKKLSLYRDEAIYGPAKMIRAVLNLK